MPILRKTLSFEKERRRSARRRGHARLSRHNPLSWNDLRKYVNLPSSCAMASVNRHRDRRGNSPTAKPMIICLQNPGFGACLCTRPNEPLQSWSWFDLLCGGIWPTCLGPATFESGSESRVAWAIARNCRAHRLSLRWDAGLRFIRITMQRATCCGKGCCHARLQQALVGFQRALFLLLSLGSRDACVADVRPDGAPCGRLGPAGG